MRHHHPFLTNGEPMQGVIHVRSDVSRVPFLIRLIFLGLPKIKVTAKFSASAMLVGENSSSSACINLRDCVFFCQI